MEDKKTIISLTEISEEWENAGYHFQEAFKHSLQGTSSLLKIVTLLLEQNVDVPGSKSVNTVVLLVKAAVDIWSVKVAPENDKTVIEAKKDAYDTISRFLSAEIDMIEQKGDTEDKKEYVEALHSILILLEKEIKSVDRENEPEKTEKIVIE